METVLVINPGSTSTKLALFANHDCLAEETLRHSVQELAPFENVVSQTPFRKQMIAEFLDRKSVVRERV